MASYFITGVSRGLGYEFLRNISSNPANTVIGLVRNKPATDALVAKLNRSNIHILEGDMTNYDSLKRVAAETAKITGGSLDWIIANAAFISEYSAYDPIGAFAQDPTGLERDMLDSFQTNVIANVHLFNLLMPLILKGRVKKVITISTGMADIELIAKYEVALGSSYSISKAAMNAVVAKYSAEYAQDGVLFMGICPGVVDTHDHSNDTDEQKAKLMGMFTKFKKYAPHFEGPATPEDSVKDVLGVAEKASVADGYGGAYISHLGTKQWL